MLNAGLVESKRKEEQRRKRRRRRGVTPMGGRDASICFVNALQVSSERTFAVIVSFIYKKACTSSGAEVSMSSQPAFSLTDQKKK